MQDCAAEQALLLRVLCWFVAAVSSQTLVTMQPAAVAALAAVVDHVHADTLNKLLLERDRLLEESQQLAQQVEMFRRAEQWLQAGEIESAEGWLSQVIESSDWD